MNPVQSLYALIQKTVNNSGGEYFVAYASDLWGEIQLKAYNTANYSTFKLTLKRALLTNLDTVQFSYDDRDSYLKQTVTFAYQEAEVS